MTVFVGVDPLHKRWRAQLQLRMAINYVEGFPTVTYLDTRHDHIVWEAESFPRPRKDLHPSPFLRDDRNLVLMGSCFWIVSSKGRPPEYARSKEPVLGCGEWQMTRGRQLGDAGRRDLRNDGKKMGDPKDHRADFVTEVSVDTIPMEEAGKEDWTWWR